MKSKKLISSLLALALSVGSFAALTVVSAEENAQAPTWSIVSASEDFEDETYDSIFEKISGTIALGNGVLNLKSGATKEYDDEGKKVSGELARVRVKANDDMKAAIEADGTGKLVYQVDFQFGTTGGGIYNKIGDGDGLVLKTMQSWVDPYKDKKPHTHTYVFDLQMQTVSTYIDGTLNGSPVSYKAEDIGGKTYYDPINSGVIFGGWVEYGFNVDVDNFKAAYITGEPTLVSAITVGGVTPVNDEVTLSNKAYAGLSEADVVVTAAEGTDVKKTVETVDGVKTVKVTASQWPATETYTITCAKAYPNNEWATEDLEDNTYDSIFGTSPLGTSTLENGVMNLKANNLADGYGELPRVTIKANDAIKAAIVADGTGKLIYQYDIKCNTATGNTFTNRIADFNGFTMHSIVATSATYNDSNWHTVKIVFDLKEKMAYTYVDDKQVETHDYVNMIETKRQYYDPIKGIMFVGWVPADYNIDIDNVGAAYITAQEEIISSIRVAGKDVVDGTVAVPNEKFFTLSEADVEVTMAAGYENAKIKVQAANGTLTVTASEFPYTSTKSIKLTQETEGLYAIEADNLLASVIGTMTDETDPLDETNTNKVKKMINGSNWDAISKIVPTEDFINALPEVKTGQLIYQFDVYNPDGDVTLKFMDDKAMGAFGKTTKWATMTVVYDYESGIAGASRNAESGWKPDAVQLDSTDPLQGVKIVAGASTPIGYYVKNINVAYLENKPKLVDDILFFNEIGLDNFDYTKVNQTVTLTQAQYDSLTLQNIKYLNPVANHKQDRDFKDAAARADYLRVNLDGGKYQKALYWINIKIKSVNEITSFTATKSATGIDASATYTLAELSETDNPYVIIAVYEDNRLIGTELFDADADEDKSVTFNLTYNLNAEKTYTAKAMLWDMTTLLPLVGAKELTVE